VHGDGVEFEKERILTKRRRETRACFFAMQQDKLRATHGRWL
jgi:hypothetical protein